MDANEVRELLLAAVDGNQASWAREHGVSAPYVHDVLRGRRAPGAAILEALRLRKIVRYERLTVA